jgi:hypothetical protein
MDQITMQFPPPLVLVPWVQSLGCIPFPFCNQAHLSLCLKKRKTRPHTPSRETIPFHLPLEENSMLFHKSIQGFMHEKRPYQHARNTNNNSTLIGAFQELLKIAIHYGSNCHAPIVKNPFPCTPQPKTKFPLMHFNSEEYMFWEQGTQIFARR